MSDRLPPAHLAAAVAVAVATLLVGLRLSSGAESPAPAAQVPVRLESGDRNPSGGGRVVVHVAGAVRRPGVYRLRRGSRVDEAVERAGGPTARADLTPVNLAGVLEDGRQIVVPERVPPAGRAVAAPPVPGSASAPAGTAPGATGPPINLNTATLEQLDALDGIGPATAQKILDFRAEQGGFGSVEELAQIPGIGEVRMATLRERLTV